MVAPGGEMSEGARILIIGGGARSHALGRALEQSPGVSRVVFAPGTTGLERLAGKQGGWVVDYRGCWLAGSLVSWGCA